MTSNARRRLNLELYKKLFLIRRTEERIIEHYPENEMKAPMHLYLGGEAIAAGVCHALGQDNQVLCTYRSHGVYLANTMETNRFFGELYGKATGMAKGRGGSMHLSSPKTGLLGASAIVASVIPVAVGSAFANQYQNNGKTIAVFFGDGAVEEGNFWEALNMACLLKLHVLFVCEDNGFAVHTPISQRHGYNSISQIVGQFNCSVLNTETTDVEIIHDLAQKAVSSIKKENRPMFLHAKYYRYRRHVGIEEDFESGYRTRDEFGKWLAVDPIHLQKVKLLELGISEAEIELIEEEISIQIQNDIESAQEAPFPNREDLYERKEEQNV